MTFGERIHKFLFPKTEIMHYKLNKLSANLALLAIVCNALMFLHIYGIKGCTSDLYLGIDLVINIVFMLFAFLCSENQKKYDIKAGFISIGLGQTDVIYKAQLYGLNVLDLSDYASLPAGIANIGKLLNQYFNYYKKAYPMLLDYIKEINPDAKVVLVSTMNPIEHATATDDFAIQIGCLINGIMDTMNSFIKDCALRYGYMYVDITEVETPSSATTMSLEHIFGITDSTEYALIAHPTTKGYTQIAQKVITAVKNELQKDSINSVQTFFAYIFNRLKQIFVDFFSRFNIFSK